MSFSLSKFLRWLFVPHFNEVTLFSMSLACLLLISTNFNFNTKFTANPTGGGDYPVFVISALILIGFFLSVYHAFSRRRKTSIDKSLMLFFASIISGFGGIWAGAYLWYQTESWLRIVPLWNVISGYVLVASVRETSSHDQRIAEENASLLEIAISTLITVAIFLVSQYFFKLHWAATFSITVAYATNINEHLLGTIFSTVEKTENA